MAYLPTEDLIDKVALALRLSDPGDAIRQEISLLVMECWADLESLGVSPERVRNEHDPLILGALRSYARWKFGLNNPDAEANRENYMQQRDELRKRVGYCTSAEQ